MMTQPPPDLTPENRAALLHALSWQIELGADECIGEAPSDRFAETAPAPKAPPKPTAAKVAERAPQPQAHSCSCTKDI